MTKKKTYEFKPDWYVEPGRTISELLDNKQMTLGTFAEQMNKSVVWCARLICAAEEIDEEIAQKLSEVVGGTKQFWINREQHFRDDKERITGSRYN